MTEMRLGDKRKKDIDKLLKIHEECFEAKDRNVAQKKKTEFTVTFVNACLNYRCSNENAIPVIENCDHCMRSRLDLKEQAALEYYNFIKSTLKKLREAKTI
jgi:hypothetical protein